MSFYGDSYSAAHRPQSPAAIDDWKPSLRSDCSHKYDPGPLPIAVGNSQRLLRVELPVSFKSACPSCTPSPYLLAAFELINQDTDRTPSCPSDYHKATTWAIWSSAGRRQPPKQAFAVCHAYLSEATGLALPLEEAENVTLAAGALEEKRMRRKR